MGAMLFDPIAKQIKSSRPWGAPTVMDMQDFRP